MKLVPNIDTEIALTQHCFDLSSAVFLKYISLFYMIYITNTN